MQSDEESPERKYTPRRTSTPAGPDNEQTPTPESPRSPISVIQQDPTRETTRESNEERVRERPEPEKNACDETRPGDIETEAENVEESEVQRTNQESSKKPNQVAKRAHTMPAVFVALQRLQEPQQAEKMKTRRGQAATTTLLG